MKHARLAQALFALGTFILGSCSVTPEPAAPLTAKHSANNAPPYCPDGDCPSGGGGGGGGGGTTPTCVAPTSTIKSRITREANLYARSRGWIPTAVIVGIEGCDGIYPFSLEFTTQSGVNSWVGGRYNAASNTIDVDYINL
ncbi:hypothetical protein DNI29_14355 [Hymenobacter sediminis]|uniref:hypothetical protein n=1 Tax=Hymenobacter sediminis TaxID=2218621 RepID=UPI000F511113|nr:hypothetical protein [Hymenobacter sediminis]RPD46185.1 hypothetical protein DNI29_14355 [Hymenobacter sediminis]